VDQVTASGSEPALIHLIFLTRAPKAVLPVRAGLPKWIR
jgi:hypothetical protein